MAMMTMAARKSIMLKAIITVTSLATLVTKMITTMARSMTSSHQVAESQKYKCCITNCSLAFLGGLKNVKAPGGGEWMSGVQRLPEGGGFGTLYGGGTYCQISN